MPKRIFLVLLCAAILFLLLPSAGFADGALSFIAVDDLLPADLINTPIYSGGTIYVPAWLFTSYGLGLSYRYDAANSLVSFTAGEKQLFFSLASGRTYDGDNYHYTAPALVSGGTVYVPLSFMCAFFGGFSYSNVGGNEYGTVLRIHTGREVLTDEEFLRLATPAMQRYYEAYNPAGVEPDPSPTPSGSTVTKPTHEGETVRLGLKGLPNSAVPDLLLRLEMGSCFFLTAEEIRSDPDMVRRLACEGFGLGVACPGGTEAEFAEAAALLWEAARVPAVMVLLPEGAAIPSGAAAVFTAEEESDGGDRMAEVSAVTAALDAGRGDTSLVFPCDRENETAFSVLAYFLRDQGFTVVAMRETDGEG